MPIEPTDITPDEVMVTCIARQVEDREVVAQGIATPLIAAAYILARRTHAPNLYFMSAIGQGVCRYPAPISVLNVEELWLARSLTQVGFARAVTEGLPSMKPKEFFRPGQIDKHGNFNNIAIGKNIRTPRLRLPGVGGIPDVTTYLEKIYLYVPRHSRVTFVEEIDARAGLGYSPQRVCGTGPKYLVSDLGQFGFVDGIMTLMTIHPGVELDRIRRKTGFDLQISPDCRPTPLPTHEELELLRNEIDPLGIRKLEFMSGASRRQLLHEIINTEHTGM